MKKDGLPDDVEFVPGMGVFNVRWIGLLGKTLKRLKLALYEKILSEF